MGLFFKERNGMDRNLDIAGDIAYEEKLRERLVPLRVQGVIDIEKGLEGSESLEHYLELIGLFYKTIDERAAILDRCYAEGDGRNYVMRIHTVKSSALIIGAMKLAEEASELESAGKRQDFFFIRDHHAGFMHEYLGMKELLSKVLVEDGDAHAFAKTADEEMIRNAYREIREAAEEMDCDRLDEVMGRFDGYLLPEEEVERFERVRDAVGRFAYGSIGEILDEKIE